MMDKNSILEQIINDEEVFKFGDEFNVWFDECTEANLVVVESAAIAIEQPWGRIDPETDYLGLAYDRVLEFVRKVKGELLRGLKKASRRSAHPKILIGVKSIDAFIDKIVNRGKDALRITDVLRSAVLLEDDEDVMKTISGIKKAFKVVEYERKDRGKQGEFGYYGSHHFLVKLSNGVIAEIQVMTKKLWAYKEEAHKIYAKYRSAKDADAAMKKLDAKYSRLLFDLGNRRKEKPNKKRFY